MKKMIIALIAACLLLSGCGAPKGGTDAPASTAVMKNYYEKCYPLPAGDRALDIARIGDGVLLLVQRGEERYLALARYGIGENGRSSLSAAKQLSLDIGDGLIPVDISSGGDGCFYALLVPEESSGVVRALQISPEGELMGDCALPSDGDAPMGILVMPTEEWLLFCAEELRVCSADGGEIYSAPLPGNFISAEMTDMGAVVFLSDWEDGTLPCYLVDTSARELKALGTEEKTDVLATCQGLDGEYIISDGRSLLEYDPTSGAFEALGLWNPSLYAQDALLTACRLNSGEFLCALRGKEYLLLAGAEEGDPTEMEQLRVAVLMPDGAGKMAAEYCADLILRAELRGGEYNYVPEYYQATEADRLLAELTGGNAPDLLLCFGGINTAGGAFEDLYPYLDADTELTRDSFLPNLLEATSVKGKLYQLWDQVCVNTVTAPASLVGDRTDYTPADYAALLESHSEYSSIFPAFIHKKALLSWVAELGISAYTDKDSASCDFTAGEFKELLAWCAAMPAEEQETDTEQKSMLELRIICSLASDYAGYKDGVPTYEPKRFVGFPDGRGGCNYYSNALGTAVTMAIPAASGHKQGAWEFIREQLVFSAQAELGEGACLPVNYAALKHVCASSMSPQSAELLEGLLERTRYAENFSDTAMMDIITSCGVAYLNGDKSLDETVENIQSRVSIYLSEQYG